MIVLITGATSGFGMACAKLFSKKGYKAILIGRRKERLLKLAKKLGIKKNLPIQLDVRNKDDWGKAIKNQEIIIHLAAETGTGQSMYEVEKYNDINVMGTANMLELLANSNHNIKKIVVASSRSIYGEGKYNCETHGVQYPSQRKEEDMEKGEFNPKCSICNSTLNVVPTDEQSKIHPSSIYGINKQQQEQMVMLMGKSLGISAVAFRYQNVYGPGQSLSNPYTGILSIFSTRILNGNNLDIYEDGEETRDFVYIEDVVDATILGIEKEEANGQIFNIGSGIATTVLDVANTLKRLYNSEININISGKFRLGDIRHNFADLSKSKDILGFTPKYNFERGITEFVNWVKTQEVMEDKYKESIQKLKNKGLMK